MLAAGCLSRDLPKFHRHDDLSHYTEIASRSIEPDLEGVTGETLDDLPPHLIESDSNVEYWDLSLEEGIRIALSNSTILRDLQGRVMTAPAATPSIYDPAIQESNGQFGVEAALSAFDAQWSSSLFFNSSDRPLNSPEFDGSNILLQQNLGGFTTEVNKTTGYGTQFFIRNNTGYDSSNRPGLVFPSAWNADFELGVQQPLLLGAGEVNRIAGPNATPGFFFGNGVVIARLNTDISIHEFETAVTQYISDIEDAYWELAFAYRNLDAQRTARDAALETWRRIHAFYVVGRQGGEAEAEAQAREQLFFFESQVKNALSGTETGGGVLANERRLRRLLGLPSTDRRLVRPSDEPISPKIVFAWEDAIQESVTKRVELRQQRIQIRVREMQLIAAKNFLLPRLDAFATYRFTGLGDDLLGTSGPVDGTFSNAYRNLFDADFQEWQVGMQYIVPLGFRRAYANLRNAQLQLAREHAILRDQESQVAFELANSLGELDRARATSLDNLHRFRAAQDNVEAVTVAYSIPRVTFDVVVQAQRLRAEAETALYRSMIDYMKALKSVHLRKGSLLEYDGVYLAEGPWPSVAYHQARCAERFPRQINYVMRTAGPPRSVVVTTTSSPEPPHTEGLTPASAGASDSVEPLPVTQREAETAWYGGPRNTVPARR
jgi:outer membrane protein TolC